MDWEDMHPPGDAEDRADADLDAVLFAAGDRMLDAIRRSLDLDVGLAQIIGDPLREDTAGRHEPAGPEKDLAGTSARSDMLYSKVTSHGPRSRQFPAASQPDTGEITGEAPAPVVVRESSAAPERAAATDDGRRGRHREAGRPGSSRLVMTAAVLAGALMAFISTAALAVSRRIPAASPDRDDGPRGCRRTAFQATAVTAAVTLLTSFLAMGFGRVGQQPEAATVPAAQPVDETTVDFLPYEARLSESAKASLRQWVITIPRDWQSDFMITGYTADYEASVKNVTLSLRRAQAVADFLEGNGVKATQMSVVSLWDAVPYDLTNRVIVLVKG